MRALRRRGFSWMLVAALGLSLGVEAVVAQRATRERHLVVTVVDDKTPIADLSLRNFVVREDGIAREIVGVTPAPLPSHIALVVDNSAATRDLIPDLRAALVTFIDEISSSATPPAMGLSTTGERPTTVVAPGSSAALVAIAANRITARPGSGAYFLDAIIETANGLRPFDGARPVIVAFVAEGGEEFSSAQHQQVEAALRRSRAALWTVVLQDHTPSGSSESRERSLVLGNTVEASGGFSHVVLSKEGLLRAFTLVSSTLASGYDVAYGRPDTLIPPTSVSVTVNVPRARVLVRKWTD